MKFWLRKRAQNVKKRIKTCPKIELKKLTCLPYWIHSYLDTLALDPFLVHCTVYLILSHLTRTKIQKTNHNFPKPLQSASKCLQANCQMAFCNNCCQVCFKKQGFLLRRSREMCIKTKRQVLFTKRATSFWLEKLAHMAMFLFLFW